MNADLRISQSDKDKRTELLAEFLYWLFDSFIIPLISRHFYATEASIQNSQKIFYFRHDIWQKLSEPFIAELQRTMLKKVPLGESQRPRTLGHCGIRLLPKDTGFRPIMNLRKRAIIAVGPTVDPTLY